MDEAKVIINGREEILARRTTLAGFIKEKGFNPAVIVVEYNQKIAAKSEWDGIILKNGDTLEIISFVGGG